MSCAHKQVYQYKKDESLHVYYCMDCNAVLVRPEQMVSDMFKRSKRID